LKNFILNVLFTLMITLCIPLLIVLLHGDKEEKTENKEKNIISVLEKGAVKEYELEEYLYGVLAGEMPASFHSEALKAQAVAARTYIVNKCGSKDKVHPDADVCTDSTHCKAHLSEKEIKEKFGDKWLSEYKDKIISAINETEGEIAVFNGEAIDAVFHSSASGLTENASDVWGNDVPYLVSCESPGDLNAPNFESQVYVSFENFAELMKKCGYNVSPYVGEIEKNTTGSVKTIDIGGEKIKGTKVREIFSLPSAFFTVSADEKGFTFHCKGHGHGVGMSQYGANYFAQNGMKYDEILKKYYKGIELTKNEHINRNTKN